VIVLFVTIAILLVIKIACESRDFMDHMESTRKNVNSSAYTTANYNLRMLNKILGDGEGEDSDASTKCGH
jgi:hypothetical protein